MMATASGTLSETREKNLPPLSPNIEASQLLTPLQLARITIDNPHYQDHLMQSMLLQHQTMGPSVPTHQHVLNRRTAKLGDNYFFLQKDIPVSQTYARTALKLSDVRPWDQIVDRPLNTQKVIDKEVHLPFPQEHPYTSHISRFAVFPDTNHRSLPHPQPLNPISVPSPADKDRHQPPQESTNESSNTNGLPTAQDTPLPRTASVQTQTALTSFKPLAAYYVPQKAGEWGLRVEEHHLSVPGIPSLSADVGRTFWDLPRSRQHKRANTYPAPRFLYSAQLPTSPGQPHTTTTQCSFTPPTTANPSVPPRPGQAVPRRIPPDHTAAVTPTTLGPPPSSSLQSSPPITPRTNEALNSIHRLLTRTTTYGEHFPGQTVLSNHNGDQKNILRLDYSLRSCVSQRPWTSESRGKYCRRIPMSPRMAVEPESDNISEADSADGLGDSDGIVFSLLKGAESHKGGVESHGEAGSHDGGADPHKAQNDAKSNKETKVKGHGDQSNMVDSSTQTEEEYYFITTATPNAPLAQLRNTTLTSTAAPQLTASQSAALAYKLPQVGTTQSAKKVTLPSSKEDTAAGVQPSLRLPKASSVLEPSKLDASQLVRFPSAKRPLSAFVDTLPTYKTMLKPQHTRSYSADASYPSHQNNNSIRTAQSTRRLMTLYNGFTRSEVMKKFHEQYPEKAPDLREYSIREGKRHVISGSHAYYFH